MADLPGNQLLLEGLVSDVLCEHFGEGVELVGVTLLRHGPLSTLDLMRISNLSLLAFPRDPVNPFNAFGSTATDSVTWKTVRDALLVMLHFQLVSVANGVYTLNPVAVLHRLCLPAMLELFSDIEERDLMETVLKRGRVLKEDLDAKISNQLISKKLLVSLDTVQGSSKGLVLSPNYDELLLNVMRGFIEPFADELSVGGGAIVGELLSAGELSVADLEQRLDKLSNAQLIGGLIKLQQVRWVGKRQAVRAEPVVTNKRKSRLMNNKQLLEEEGLFSSLLETEGHLRSSVPSYALRLPDVFEYIRNELVSNLVKAKFGIDAARVFQLLIESGQKFEASHVADTCAVSREASLKHLHALALDGFAQIQEVPKIIGSAAAAGGVSAMMRAVSSSFWLYHADPLRVRSSALSLVANSIVNLRRRFRHEVTRQCRIEDRASTLTEQEEGYLQKVHEAQDVLEAASVGLVPALLFLLKTP